MHAACRSRARIRRGVTLMELLLVLVLLVVAGSLTIPAITNAFSSVRLRRAGDAVVTRFAEARTHAIETGLPYQFRFTPGTGKYRIEPWSPPASADSASGPNPGAAATPAPAAGASDKPDTPATHKTLGETPVIEAMLPETILFQGGQAAVIDPVKDERRVDSLEESKATWTTPILFFPDGSSSQATVVLQNDAVQYLRITLRGLTSVARVSPVMTRAELDQTSQSR